MHDHDSADGQGERVIGWRVTVDGVSHGVWRAPDAEGAIAAWWVEWRGDPMDAPRLAARGARGGAVYVHALTGAIVVEASEAEGWERVSPDAPIGASPCVYVADPWDAYQRAGEDLTLREAWASWCAWAREARIYEGRAADRVPVVVTDVGPGGRILGRYLETWTR